MSHEQSEVSRRIVLRGAATAGIAVPLLAACGNDDGGSVGGDGGGGGGDGVVTTADVPVGSGKILSGEQAVVTQPSKGEFKAFTAVCTHQGCLVSTISDGTINCDCHGSKFSIEDGSVVNGPARAPLEEKKVTVEGDQISVG